MNSTRLYNLIQTLRYIKIKRRVKISLFNFRIIIETKQKKYLWITYLTSKKFLKLSSFFNFVYIIFRLLGNLRIYFRRFLKFFDGIFFLIHF